MLTFNCCFGMLKFEWRANLLPWLIHGLWYFLSILVYACPLHLGSRAFQIEVIILGLWLKCICFQIIAINRIQWLIQFLFVMLKSVASFLVTVQILTFLKFTRGPWWLGYPVTKPTSLLSGQGFVLTGIVVHLLHEASFHMSAVKQDGQKFALASA